MLIKSMQCIQMITAIVARYQEDLQWTKELKVDDIIVVQKGTDMENRGREPTSYLWYIINNYDSLEGIYFFTQGHLIHYPDIVNHEFTEEFTWFPGRPNEYLPGTFTCDMDAQPHDFLDIKTFLKEAGLEYNKELITFNSCCLFSISAEDIKKNSKDYYQRIYDAILKVPKGEYVFERLVRHIFYKDQDQDKEER